MILRVKCVLSIIPEGYKPKWRYMYVYLNWLLERKWDGNTDCLPPASRPMASSQETGFCPQQDTNRQPFWAWDDTHTTAPLQLSEVLFLTYKFHIFSTAGYETTYTILSYSFNNKIWEDTKTNKSTFHTMSAYLQSAHIVNLWS